VDSETPEAILTREDMCITFVITIVGMLASENRPKRCSALPRTVPELATLIEAGQLRFTDERGSSVLTPNEIGLRFNNWDRLRAEHLPMSLALAAAGGAMVMLFILVATGRLTYRGEQGIHNSSARHPGSRG
jgi:hypothetical protein